MVPDVAAGRVRQVRDFIARMNPLAFPRRMREEARLNSESVGHAQAALERERRLELLRAEADVRGRRT